jgi:hypothetical protein
MITLVPADALEFIKALTGSPATACTWQTFDDDSSRKDPSLTKILHGSLSKVYDELGALNGRGAGIFLTINETDLRGRKEKNIVRVRSHVVDADGLMRRPYAVSPSFTVKTSPGKLHAYFLGDGTATLADFANVQTRLAEFYGTDPSVKDLPRVMRVPGFEHRKGEPFFVRFVPGSGIRYSVSDLIASHPVVSAEPEAPSPTPPPKPTEARVIPATRDEKLLQIARDAASARPWSEGSRHESAKATATHARKLGLTDDAVRSVVLEFASAAGLPDSEIDPILDWTLANVAADPAEIAPRPTLKLPAPAPIDRKYTASGSFEWIPTPEPAPRPHLVDAAFHGFAGRYVRMIAPHTEADPFGILVCFLTAFGIAVGRSPHVRVGADRHGAHLYVTLVGDTSEGRKGTAYAEGRRIFPLAGPNCVPPSASGLSSGEGFVWAIRDQIRKMQPVRKNGRITGHEEIIDDPGVSDKRLLVIESELASVLARMAREGNTLSPLMRQGWDGHDLCTLTKKPVRATDPHVGLVAQITPAELAKLMTETDVLNGWGNRMMYASVWRPHLLPFGGSLRDSDLSPLAQELKETIDLVKQFGEMERDEEANAAWERAYPLLTADRPGLFGAITARAPQQVIRLSLIYGLLDRARKIGAVHLKAALAVWKASQESAAWLFGGALGDTVADDLVVELQERPEGMTRNEIRELFQRNVRSGRIGQALDLLSRLHLAAGRREASGQKGGRPVERWFHFSHLDAVNALDAETSQKGGNSEGVTASTAFSALRREEKTQAEGAI